MNCLIHVLSLVILLLLIYIFAFKNRNKNKKSTKNKYIEEDFTLPVYSYSTTVNTTGNNGSIPCDIYCATNWNNKIINADQYATSATCTSTRNGLPCNALGGTGCVCQTSQNASWAVPASYNPNWINEGQSSTVTCDNQHYVLNGVFNENKRETNHNTYNFNQLKPYDQSWTFPGSFGNGAMYPDNYPRKPKSYQISNAYCK